MIKTGSKFSSGYATVTDDDGVNYRTIAETMTELGFKMNHSSARNYVLRVMKKFATAIVPFLGKNSSEEEIERIVKDPNFQQGIADILHVIESERRLSDNRDTYTQDENHSQEHSSSELA